MSSNLQFLSIAALMLKFNRGFYEFLSTMEIKIGKAQDVHQGFFVEEPEAATSLWIPIVF